LTNAAVHIFGAIGLRKGGMSFFGRRGAKVYREQQMALAARDGNYKINWSLPNANAFHSPEQFLRKI
jgi:hypothetical protein